jgi:hypothetical protein
LSTWFGMIESISYKQDTIIRHGSRKLKRLGQQMNEALNSIKAIFSGTTRRPELTPYGHSDTQGAPEVRGYPDIRLGPPMRYGIFNRSKTRVTRRVTSIGSLVTCTQKLVQILSDSRDNSAGQRRRQWGHLDRYRPLYKSTSQNPRVMHHVVLLR